MAKNHANDIKVVKGYKAFNSDWTCKGFQYEVGKTYKIDGKIKVCERGFHFCTKLIDCFAYYPFENETKVAEVEATGLIIDSCDSSKKCTNEITIVREIPWDEVLRLCNTGNYNTGNYNTGNKNAGDWNTGDLNTGNHNAGHINTGDHNTGNDNAGNHNTGDLNTGNRNTGYWNVGNWNTGNGNIGNWNTGNCNIGNHNTGDWNTASYSTGCFCTEEKKIELFDKPSDMTLSEWRSIDAYFILTEMPTVETVTWVSASNMTDMEKSGHPEYSITGGYLRVTKDKSAPQKWFDSLSNNDKMAIMSIPNFDAEKFMMCTGIDVRK